MLISSFSQRNERRLKKSRLDFFSSLLKPDRMPCASSAKRTPKSLLTNVRRKRMRKRRKRARRRRKRMSRIRTRPSISLKVSELFLRSMMSSVTTSS